MSKTLTEIAQQLKDSQKKVQLIYAFNGTGKTRLSREFKQLIAPKSEDDEGVELSRNKILYYNAFTEDLFYWDNDLEGDSAPKLKIQPNTYTEWLLTLLKDLGQDGNIIRYFQRYTNDKLTPNFSVDFTEVTFSLERGDDEQLGNLKISKGEESNFIWSVFYTLLDQVITIRNISDENLADRETNQFDQLEYIFIDDPVSSLDDNHLIQLAVNLGQLIKSSSSDIKFIISTHNALFYNVIYNELSAKGGYVLSCFDDGTFEIEEKKGDSNKSFSYHLHIKKLIEQAIESNTVQRYHFALLRNLYEKTANFLGYQGWSDLLPGDKKAYASRIMNFYPHNTLSNEEIAEPTPPEKEMVGLLLRNLNEYGYWQQGETNG
ncbi:TPA: AAA family ATPase [Acinetobacter baumannii]|uniref:AAA family ATPase n=1 Tax=Acinetobacter calcoaceticus/baumannii complex TaxID=909768 RepID=UPI0021CE0A47|nr:AAA family ATPase [Acinetobacter pittii]MCU4525396.1 AAA family ATPase [Acinetobacter pittii]HCJ6510788.1 AAA family ATPase [Acinetobacter baumannii]HEE6562531.1 AAA family ATPase [Acinetobacter baumannii]